MEVHTGASVSNVSTFNQIKNENGQIPPTKSKLKTYTGEIVKPKGEVKVNMEYKDQSICIIPVILTENRPNLLGRNVLKFLLLNLLELFNICNISEISAVCEKDPLKEILSDYKDIFNVELRTLKGVEISLQVDPDAKPHSSPSTICPEGQN